MIPPAVRRRYDDLVTDLEVVARKVEETVLHFCKNNGFAYQGRKKTADSLAGKLESGRYASVGDVDDLFACSIIIPTLNHEESVLDFLRRVFVEITTRGRQDTKKDPHVFRFEATRFIGSLGADAGGEPRQQAQLFEVQIRTAFEHAWSVATHDLAYKADRINWKTERLAAQLKASVEQLDALAASFEPSAEQLLEHEWPELAAQSLILDTFNGMIADNLIPEECRPRDWQGFTRNVLSLVRNTTGPFRQKKLDEKVKLLLAASDKAASDKGCPTSVSLFQFVMATGVTLDVFPARFNDSYHPLVTPELVEFYPATSNIQNTCNLDT